MQILSSKHQLEGFEPHLYSGTFLWIVYYTLLSTTWFFKSHTCFDNLVISMQSHG